MGERDGGCKVCKVIEYHGLHDFNERLLQRWMGDSTERMGYRKLAERLNVLLLRQAMDRAGVSTLGGEAKARYERLQGDDETTAKEVREILTNEGINMGRLEKSFVSYGVIRTHILDCLNAEREDEDSDWEVEALQITRKHAKSKALDAVRSLLNKDRISASENIALHVDIYVECEECQTRIPLDRVLRRGEVCKCNGRN